MQTNQVSAQQAILELQKATLVEPDAMPPSSSQRIKEEIPLKTVPLEEDLPRKDLDQQEEELIDLPNKQAELEAKKEAMPDLVVIAEE